MEGTDPRERATDLLIELERLVDRQVRPLTIVPRHTHQLLAAAALVRMRNISAGCRTLVDSGQDDVCGPLFRTAVELVFTALTCIYDNEGYDLLIGDHVRAVRYLNEKHKLGQDENLAEWPDSGHYKIEQRIRALDPKLPPMEGEAPLLTMYDIDYRIHSTWSVHGVGALLMHLDHHETAVGLKSRGQAPHADAFFELAALGIKIGVLARLVLPALGADPRRFQEIADELEELLNGLVHADAEESAP